MKILVTGGAGFIGSHLVNRLIENHEVNVLDIHNYMNGRKFIGSILDISAIKKSISGCDAVFHLAALTDLRNIKKEDNFKVNYLGSRNLFDEAEKVGAKIIFTSSAAVYGNSFFAKENTKCKPVSDYGKNKLKSEFLLKDKNAFIARLFNVCGPGGKSVINKFCKEKSVKIFGSGLQTRDYIYVSDVIDALLLGLKNKGIYNIGTGIETSLFEIIDEIEKISRTKLRTVFEQSKNEVKRSRADISKISKLGWRPKIKLEDSIRKIWNYENSF